MNSFKIAVIPGDGIGPEVIREGTKVLSAVSGSLSSRLEFVEFDCGASRYLKTKEAMPESLLEEIFSCDAIYLGAVGDPRVPPGILEREILLRLRFDLDLYINLRPCSLYPGAFTPIKGKGPDEIDFVVVRENSESVYAGMGGIFKRGTADEVAIQEDIHTRKGVERAIRFAFETCKARGGKNLLTMVDKANVLTHAHNLWRRTFEALGSEYPQVNRNAAYVDAAAMDFVRRPEIFDVVVTNNIFGDILTDLGAIISGGLGLAASANIHPLADKTRKQCRGLFEPVHGSAPDIAGKGAANPLAAILAGKMMLEFLGERQAAIQIEKAVKSAVRSGKIFKKDSADIGMHTAKVGELVCDSLSSLKR